MNCLPCKKAGTVHENNLSNNRNRAQLTLEVFSGLKSIAIVTEVTGKETRFPGASSWNELE